MTGWTPSSPRCAVVIIARSVVSIGRRGSERNWHAGERLVAARRRGRMQDRAYQQGVAGLFPVVPALPTRPRGRPGRRRSSERRDLPFAPAHLEQRIVRSDVALVGSNRGPRPTSPASRRSSSQFSPSMSSTIATRPGQQRGDHKPDTLSGPGWRETQDHAPDHRGADIGRAIGRADAIIAQAERHCELPRSLPIGQSRRW